jgi:sulfate adenylyltransferase
MTRGTEPDTRFTEDVALIEPWGGTLVNLLAGEAGRESLRRRAVSLPSIRVSERVACDLELLATGAFSPLDRFMGQRDYESVLDGMRLASGVLFPVPVTLPVSEQPPLHAEVALRDSRNDVLAILRVDEVYEWDRQAFARAVLGTEDARHPLVSEMDRWGRWNVSGPLTVVALPKRYDFAALRRTPAETRALLQKFGRRNVVAFQTRNPLHRAHEELTKRAIENTDGVLLLHPVVGLTRPGDIDHYTRVRTYRVLAERYYDRDRIVLSLLPLAMRMAGPREALWHALIRRNYGANHFIVGRDHASPGSDSTGRPFYGPYDAQELVRKHSRELGMTMVPFEELVFVADENRFEEVSRVPDGARVLSISGTQVRDEYLNAGRPLPEWFTRPEVASILASAHPARHRQGVCVWFTGLSGAGKSATAEVLTALLLEHGRRVTLLDGDVVRTNLSRGLGFSREDREVNIERVGFVAAEIVRHGGVAICALISPYRAARNRVREMMDGERFVEVYVNTPIEVCEQRDTKGLYAGARSGKISQVTGVDDPYEWPLNPEVELDTVTGSAEDNARRIVALLMERGFITV